ncbi:MAG: helix-turn-helix transcriptional regulator [Clostridia bacterium]|nr:helix-turn-helix transcriptional regulator [Clostridia bacterium]
MDIHKRLCQLLDERGWSEYKLAKECGLSESTLANIFRRNTLPTVGTLEAICSGFGITLSHFFADGDMVEMTPELKMLFENWVTLTAEQKNVILQMMKTLNSNK